MITERKSVSLAEADEVLGSLEETEKSKETGAFIKKFSKMTATKAKKMREGLGSLNLAKLKERDITKIIDILPEDAVDLNKIITEVTLDADETSKILEVVKTNK